MAKRLAVYVVDLARQSRVMLYGGAGGAGQEDQGQERLALLSGKTVTWIWFYFFPFEQAIIAAARRRLWRRRESNAAGAHVCSISCLVRHVSRNVFSFACT